MRRRTRIGAGISVLCAILGATSAAGQNCPSAVPHITGTWVTLPYLMPVNPVSATLLHDGKILIIAGSEADANNSAAGAESYRAAIWDPTGADAGSVSLQSLEYDVFCSGTALLPHGRPLIVGGTSDYSFKGDNRASFFDPATGRFSQSQSMVDGRWYATATVLGDGRIMAISGLGASGVTNPKVEIYDVANAGAGWGPPINEPFTPPLFPREFLLPSGKVFFTGQGAGAATSRGYLFDPVAKSWTPSANTTTSRDYGSAVLLPLLPPVYTPKVMAFGGGGSATGTTEVIDLSAPVPVWTAGPGMSASRVEMNAILLPNGRVLIEGGSAFDEAPDEPGKNADIYDPAVGAMGPGGTASYSRLYHSSALLLPDATVISVGSNPGDRGSYEPAIEIYTPAYLYDANDRPITTGRPVITGVTPAVLGYNAPFTVSASSGSPISSAVLVRPGSSTHAFDMEQRVIGLCGPTPQPPCGASGTLNLTTPPNGNVAPPGFYMLFLLDASGVPSKARFLELTGHTATPPTGSIASPPADTTINAGGAVFFSTNTIAAKYSWVFPGGAPANSTLQTPGVVAFASPGEYAASLTVIDGGGDADRSPPTRTITVLPPAPDFDISVAPGSVTVLPGGTAQFTVTVTPVRGFNGTVSLAVDSESGFPPGVVSGGFSPPAIAGSGTSILTVNTTTAALPYALSLTVTGVSGALAHTASTTLLVNLASPAGVTASPSNAQVALSWQPPVGATGYRVSRSLVSGGPYQGIGCPAAPAYVDAGLQNGTTYWYVVSATYDGGPDGGGASAPSAETSATPACPVPVYSGSLSASKSPTGTTWSWTAGGAAAFDLVRGDLPTLRATGGDFRSALDAIPPTEAACLANDASALSVVDPFPDPRPGGGVFTLIRAVAIACPARGSYDDGSPSLHGPRDPGIGASTRGCP